MEKTLPYVPHGVVFIYDPTIDELEIPENPDCTTTATETCVSVSTRTYVDGPVSFNLSNKFSIDDNLIYKSFQGYIETASKKVAIMTSETDVILEKDVKAEKTQVTVWVNDKKFSTVVMVEAE